jgi:hypothetical protein
MYLSLCDEYESHMHKKLTDAGAQGVHYTNRTICSRLVCSQDWASAAADGLSKRIHTPPLFDVSFQLEQRTGIGGSRGYTQDKDHAADSMLCVVCMCTSPLENIR